MWSPCRGRSADPVSGCDVRRRSSSPPSVKFLTGIGARPAPGAEVRRTAHRPRGSRIRTWCRSPRCAGRRVRPGFTMSAMRAAGSVILLGSEPANVRPVPRGQHRLRSHEGCFVAGVKNKRRPQVQPRAPHDPSGRLLGDRVSRPSRADSICASETRPGSIDLNALVSASASTPPTPGRVPTASLTVATQ